MLAFLVLFCAHNLVAQLPAVQENFIRIVGLAEKEVKSEGLELTMTMSEIPPNEYQKVMYKSLASVKEEFNQFLASKNIPKANLKQDVLSGMKTRYKKQANETYTLKVKNEAEALEFTKTEINGLAITKAEHVYPEYDPKLDEEMAIAAIEDARRKASNIAKAIGRKLGKILNIEDQTGSDTKRNYGKSAAASKYVMHRISVTFELQ